MTPVDGHDMTNDQIIAEEAKGGWKTRLAV